MSRLLSRHVGERASRLRGVARHFPAPLVTPRMLDSVSDRVGYIPATISFVASSIDTTDLTTVTFTAHAIGAAHKNRKVVVAVTGAVSTRTVSTLTVAGASAELVRRQQSGTTTVEMWQADVMEGTTGDIVVTWSGAQDRTGIGVWAVYNARRYAHDTQASTVLDPSVSLIVPADGVAIAVNLPNGSGTTSHLWTGLTEQYDQNLEGVSGRQSGASGSFTSKQSALTVTADMSDNPGTQALVAASWGPIK